MSLDNFAAEPHWEPRILQYRKKRYSIRLEKVFWRLLERAAAARNVRLGQLTAELAATLQHGNLTSLLRVFCVLEAERLAARTSLGDSPRGLYDALLECPAPGLLVSEERTLVAHNQAFADWVGRPAATLAGVDLDSLFQVRSHQPPGEAWQKLADGTLDRLRVRLVYLAPGRVSTVEALFLPFRSKDRGQFHALAWLYVNPPRQLPSPVKSPDSP